MKNLQKPLLLTIIVFVGLAACDKTEEPEPPQLKPGALIFNEIMSTGNPDWIELYNIGEQPVDIQGYVVYDDIANKYSLPAGHTIQPGGFLLLYCDDQGTGLNLPFKLSSAGESITLEQPDGKPIDHVIFPAMDNGETYARFPDGTGLWQVTGFATPEKSNGDKPVSYFKSFSYLPDIPMVGDDIVFTVDISDGQDVSKIQIYYAVDNGTFTAIDMTTTDKITYKATVPALTADGELYYYFKLTDTANKEVLLPDDALDDPYDMTITSGPVPQLYINEFMASNSSTIEDPDSVGEYPDWIEIYNAGATPVDMGRFYFSDSGDPFDDRIPGNAPDKTTIPPGGYLLFWADSDTDQGPTHLKFKLSINGESIGLYYKDGRLIDTHTFGVQLTDVSEGRSPDGGSTWKKFTTPTPGQPNQ